MSRNAHSKSGGDVTAAQSAALMNSVRSVIEIVSWATQEDVVLRWEAVLPWFRGFGSLRTYGDSRKRIEVKFHMFEDPKRLWKIAATMKLSGEAGEQHLDWSFQHGVLYLPNQGYQNGWLRVVDPILTDQNIKPMWRSDAMQGLLKRQLFPNR